MYFFWNIFYNMMFLKYGIDMRGVFIMYFFMICLIIVLVIIKF